MKCNHCGATLPDEAKYCNICGRPTGNVRLTLEPAAQAANVTNNDRDVNREIKKLNARADRVTVLLLIAAAAIPLFGVCVAIFGRPLFFFGPFFIFFTLILSAPFAINAFLRMHNRGGFPLKKSRNEAEASVVTLLDSNGKMRRTFYNAGSEEALLLQVNDWLHTNPGAFNITCKTRTGIELGALTLRHVIREVSLEYTRAPGSNQNVYSFERTVWFGLYHKKSATLLQQWRTEHPGAYIVSASTAYAARGTSSQLLFGGIGASNRITQYIFYKKPRDYKTADV